MFGPYIYSLTDLFSEAVCFLSRQDSVLSRSSTRLYLPRVIYVPSCRRSILKRTIWLLSCQTIFPIRRNSVCTCPWLGKMAGVRTLTRKIGPAQSMRIDPDSVAWRLRPSGICTESSRKIWTNFAPHVATNKLVTCTEEKGKFGGHAILRLVALALSIPEIGIGSLSFYVGCLLRYASRCV